MSTYEVTITVVIVTASEVDVAGFVVVGAEVIPLLPNRVLMVPVTFLLEAPRGAELARELDPETTTGLLADREAELVTAELRLDAEDGARVVVPTLAEVVLR